MRLEIVFSLFLLQSFLPLTSSLEIFFDPIEIKEFRIGQKANLSIDIVGDATLQFHEISVKCGEPDLCQVTNCWTRNVSTSLQCEIVSNSVGISQLFIDVRGVRVSETYILRMLRAAFYQTLSVAFGIVVGTFVTGVTFMMGTQLELAKIRSVLRRPIGPIIGLFCQCALMPIWGAVLAELGLGTSHLVLRLALFAASTCPGGGKSSFWTIIFGGNLDLSVTMTFTQTLCAFFTMPLWMSTIGHRFTDQRVEIPFLAICQGLLVLLIPAGAGMVFIHKKPHLLKDIEKYIKRVTWIATVVFTVFGMVANWYIFKMFTMRTVVCGCLLPWTGYILAYTVAWVFRQSYQDRITIAIETGVQNIGIAVLMMLWCLPEPEVDLAMTVLIAVMLATDKPLVIIWMIGKIRTKCFPSEKDVESKYKVDGHNVEISMNGSVPSIASATTTIEHA